jgi:hypothetical protein
MYLQKVISKKYFLNWNLEGSGSGSVPQRYGSSDPEQCYKRVKHSKPAKGQ